MEGGYSLNRLVFPAKLTVSDTDPAHFRIVVHTGMAQMSPFGLVVVGPVPLLLLVHLIRPISSAV